MLSSDASELGAAHGPGGGAVALWAHKAESHQPVDAAVPVQRWVLSATSLQNAVRWETDGEGRGCEEESFKEAFSQSRL